MIVIHIELYEGNHTRVEGEELIRFKNDIENIKKSYKETTKGRDTVLLGEEDMFVIVN